MSIHRKHWKVALAYDGTDFHGWQVQPGWITIQGALADAILAVAGERVLPQGSGRTDAGVHALGQVASFSLAAPIPGSNLIRALNRVLPPTIRVLTAEQVPPDFHARHSVLGKTYQYRIFVRNSQNRGAVNSPFLARYVHACRWPLDMAAMQQAAQLVLGEHNFTSFAASDPDLTARGNNAETEPRDMVRTIFTSEWSIGTENDATNATYDLLRYTVRGNGFLHHMVRNLVGTFMEVGRGRWKPEDVSAILAARNRTLAGPTAPACGLFLMHVEYPDVTDS